MWYILYTIYIQFTDNVCAIRRPSLLEEHTHHINREPSTRPMDYTIHVQTRKWAEKKRLKRNVEDNVFLFFFNKKKIFLQLCCVVYCIQYICVCCVLFLGRRNRNHLVAVFAMYAYTLIFACYIIIYLLVRLVAFSRSLGLLGPMNAGKLVAKRGFIIYYMFVCGAWCVCVCAYEYNIYEIMWDSINHKMRYEI